MNLLKKEKIVKLLNWLILFLGAFGLFRAIIVLSEVLSPDSPRSRYSDSDGYLFFF